MPLVTVLVATHDHGPMLLRSVGSALEQSVRDLEVIIAGDGVTAETRAAASALALDPRVRFLDFPKEEGSGGTNRHRALAHGSGEVICYLDDDDLWHRDHVATLLALLTDADFAHTLPLALGVDGELCVLGVDLAREDDREGLAQGRLAVHKSVAGHTARIYRDLPHGWRNLHRSVTVADLWRQIVSRPGCRIATSTRPTALQLLAWSRLDWPLQRRLAELDEWRTRLASPQWPLLVLDALVRSTAVLQAHLVEVRSWLREGERYALSLREALGRKEASLAEAQAYAASLHTERARRTDDAREVERYVASLRAAVEEHCRRADLAAEYARSLERELAAHRSREAVADPETPPGDLVMGSSAPR
jgi:hypothetical protein